MKGQQKAEDGALATSGSTKAGELAENCVALLCRAKAMYAGLIKQSARMAQGAARADEELARARDLLERAMEFDSSTDRDAHVQRARAVLENLANAALRDDALGHLRSELADIDEGMGQLLEDARGLTRSITSCRRARFSVARFWRRS